MTGVCLARCQPAGWDEKIWRTDEMGKRYQLETKTGEITKGNIGQPGFQHKSSPLESTAPDMARYRKLLKQKSGNHKEAAHEYFREKLQGRHVEAMTDAGPIQATFTGGSWNEIKKDMAKDPLKAELVPHLPDIMASGTYAPEAPAHNHPDVGVFHTYRKIVQTSQGPKEAIVDVAERPDHMASQPEHQVYSLTREGTRAYEVRKKESAPLPDPPGRNRGRQETPTQDNNSVVRKQIIPEYELVNLRYVDALIDEERLAAKVTADLMAWLRREREALTCADAAPKYRQPLQPGPFTGPFAGLNRIRIG